MKMSGTRDVFYQTLLMYSDALVLASATLILKSDALGLTGCRPISHLFYPRQHWQPTPVGYTAMATDFT